MNTPTNDVAVPTIFTFHDFDVRTVTDESGAPWFVVRDVCDYLDLSNVAMALLKVPEHHLASIRLMSGGQVREMRIVDEPGLYRLVLRSDKPQADPFMEWVTADVLPAIRKTGSYAVDSNESVVNKLLTLQDENIQLHRKYAAVLEEKIATLTAVKQKRVHRPMTDEEKEQIIAMVASGMSQNEVARQMRRSGATVSERLRTAGANGGQMELFPAGVVDGDN